MLRLKNVLAKLLPLVLLFRVLLITGCSSSKNNSFGYQMIQESEPFLSYKAYIQQDIYLNQPNNSQTVLVPRVIKILSDMGFPVDSCVTSERQTFVKTAFVFNPEQFPTPKHHFLKISLLVEIPVSVAHPVNIKYAICTTCARCEQWYCDELPSWANQKKYQVVSRVQQLIFDFKKRLSEQSD